MNRAFIFLFIISLSSCYSVKKVTYLQSEENVLALPNNPITYLVQPNDILNIRVQSLDPEQSAFFNISSTENRNIQANEASLFLSGYSVNQDGIINLPIVGEIKVSGLTVEQIRELIQDEINKYLLDAIVLVKLTSYKISVLGDVARPGTNFVYNTQATIFEALSAAGDANISANRRNVRLIRQIEGKSYVIKMDLTDPKIIESPYYFLLPNDVIYVETSKENLFRNNLVLITVTFTAISTGLLILNFIQNN
ncbi:MAG: polysaccharide export protein [Cytophagales bacterium]|nr:polysaccharide export protein [Cytophagales bacterium]